MKSFFPIVNDAVLACRDNERWRIETGEDPARGWIHVVRSDVDVPLQGWKLHLSGCENSAAEVLRRALPVLLSETASFKIAASYDELNDLNEGNGGLSQIGKFVTVYPIDDGQAVRLTVALDRATESLRGPRVPSDRPLRPRSLVHYRYGGFGSLFVQTPIGQIVPALSAPNGQLVPDERKSKYSPPDWAPDPFVAAGVAGNWTPRGRMVGGRYLIVATLHESARGSILSAVDVVAGRSCLIKHAQRDSLIGPDGRDACDRLRHEMKVLDLLAENDRFPRTLGLIEEEEGLYLAMTEIEGSTIEQHVRDLCAQGCRPPASQVFAWARELAEILRTLHEQGIIYRDLKSPNIIVGEDERLRIVDFELAYEMGGPPVDGRGTRGYLSPQQEQGCPPSIADDVYGLGAVLYFAATGAEPSLAPRSFQLLDRPLELLNPELGPDLARVIERCLAADPQERFRSMEAVEAALLQIEERGPVNVIAPSGLMDSDVDEKLHYRRLAESVADTLCRVAKSEGDGGGLYWLSTHENRDGIAARDLSIGSAGPVLALSEVVAEIGHEEHRDVLERAARSLTSPRHPAAEVLPGLYVGEAGVGTALLRAGKVLDDDRLIAAAVDQGRLIAPLPYVSQDMFNGTAGRLRFHLWLWDATSDPQQLRHAKQAGSELLKSAEGSEESGIWWTIPPGYGGLSGSAYLGYAHGAAGIADAMLDLFEVTGDERLFAAARGAGRWLAQHSVGTLSDESGVDWPESPDSVMVGPYWCHGAAGIGQFFLHAARLGVMPEAKELVLRAALSAARGARWSGPTQCHGLAGNIEFLLDVFQWTRDPCHLDDARQLGRLLQAFGSISGGLMVWPAESPTTITPDYTVGYAGVAVALLRLSAPERLPRQLSRKGIARDSVPALRR
jgi:hypothetical protein